MSDTILTEIMASGEFGEAEVVLVESLPTSTPGIVVHRDVHYNRERKEWMHLNPADCVTLTHAQSGLRLILCRADDYEQKAEALAGAGDWDFELAVDADGLTKDSYMERVADAVKGHIDIEKARKALWGGVQC